ncbi:MAG TPA: sigma-70 family RNA polymerase sigma factor [Casimicrobiaceae bacterium]|nr:sigma-70 family RNA polymerase sigma factor [Casimicrobiaceae bacterium]
MNPPDQLSGARRVIVDDEADRALIERYRKGDREAFTELVVRYQRPIYNAAFWILRRAEDASDIAQMVFLRVAERANDYDPQYRFFSWIYRIAVNESLNLLRRSGNEDPLDDDRDIPEPEPRDPETRLSEAERAARVRQAVMTMSMVDRTVITLRHFSECSYQEIADILEVDETTVKSRLYEARQRLRSLLEDLR